MAIVASGQITITDLNDSKQLVMYIGASRSRTVVFNGVSTYTPNYSTANQVLTPQLFIAGNNTDIADQAISCKWFYQTNGAGTPTEITANTADYTLTAIGTNGLKSLTIKTNIVASNTTMAYICELVYPDSTTGFNVTSKAEIEIVKVVNGIDGTNGTDAIIGVLSNEHHSLPANESGTVSSFASAVSTLTIYKGTIDDTANWTITQALSGVTVTASGTPANRTATVTAMSADTATVTFTATRSGYANVTKVFTLTKNKQGVTGGSSTSYWLSNPSVIKMSKSKVYTPTTITVSAKSQTGTGTPSAYAGRFVIEESTDGVTFTGKYTSATNESSKTYTPTAQATSAIVAVRVKLYLAGGTTTLIDEQTIPVIADGADSIYAYVWTPDGNAIKNSTGSLSMTVDVYDGATEVTASAFKWYIQDPTATTASGGDTDGGNGWRLLNATYNAGVTGYTTATITIPASAVAGQESFKSVVTYNGIKYKGVASVVDLSDPIIVRIDGVAVFKNGEGTTTLRATLLQSGAEIDSAGTTYTYTWSIYDASNVKSAFTATGKSITVNATDINGRGNIVCEVSK